jgi:hypothetical protein
MATVSPMTINQASDLIDKSITVIDFKSAMPEEMYKKYFNFRKADGYYTKDSGISGLTESDFTDENAAANEETPIQLYDKTYTQMTITKMVSFSRVMWEYGISKRNLQSKVVELARADLRKRERLCAERLTNGASSTYTTSTGVAKTLTITGGDGSPAFSKTHTRADGGTSINNIVYDGTTYNLPFDYEGWKAALRTGSLITDQTGNPDPAEYDTLVCKYGSSVYFKAKEILGAIKAGKIPESFDNDGSGVPAFKVIALKYLANDAYWFAFDSSKMGDTYGFQFVEGSAFKTMPAHIVYKTQEIQVLGYSDFDLGHNSVETMWVMSDGTST